MELQLIKLLLDRNNFDEFSSVIRKKMFSSEDCFLVFNALKDYYDQNEETITLQELRNYHFASLGGASESFKEKLKDLYSSINDTEVKESTSAIVKKLKMSQQIENALSDYDKGDYNKFVKKIKNIEDKDESPVEFESFNYDELNALREKSEQFKWFTPTLNDFVSGFGPERSMLVLARPDTGKTSFLCASALHFVRCGAKVMFFSISEDTKEKLDQRFVQAAYNVDNNEYYSDMARLLDQFNEEFSDNIKVSISARVTSKQIEDAVKLHKPDIVFYDQFQKVTLSNQFSDRRDQLLTEVIVSLKEISKEYQHGIVCGTQASSSAEMNNFSGNKRKKWLDLNDIADSKTGVPGEFQTILGMGADEKGLWDYYNKDGSSVKVLNRYFHLCKDKNGGKGSKFMLYLDPYRCKWIEADGGIFDE